MIFRTDNIKKTTEQLLDLYFLKKGGKHDPKALLNKVILFVAETIEQGFAEANSKLFEALEQILKRIVRRC